MFKPKMSNALYQLGSVQPVRFRSDAPSPYPFPISSSPRERLDQAYIYQWDDKKLE